MKLIVPMLPAFLGLCACACAPSPSAQGQHGGSHPGKSMRTAAGNEAVRGEQPMAPFGGPSKKEVLKRLRQHARGLLEITLGRMQPQFVIRCAEGRYELLPLVLDAAKAERAGRQRLAEGQSYMPEMDWQYLAPGAPVIQEHSLQAFIAKLEAWPGWTRVE